MFSEIADPYVKQFDLMTFGGWKTLKAVQVSLHTNIDPLDRCVDALINEYQRRDLNSYDPCGSQDFKSCVSTNSTTLASGSSIL